MSAKEARGRIFGYALMNDLSACGIQNRDYMPLGLFTSNNFATTMSPWVVTATALEPYRCAMVDRGRDDGSGNPVPLVYIRDPNYGESREHHCQHLLVVWHGMRCHTFIGFVSHSYI
jgi:fumarylacetoacetase